MKQIKISNNQIGRCLLPGQEIMAIPVFIIILIGIISSFGPDIIAFLSSRPAPIVEPLMPHYNIMLKRLVWIVAFGIIILPIQFWLEKRDKKKGKV